MSELTPIVIGFSFWGTVKHWFWDSKRMVLGNVHFRKRSTDTGHLFIWVLFWISPKQNGRAAYWTLCGCRGGKLDVYCLLHDRGQTEAQMAGNGKYLVGRGQKVCSYYRCLRINQPSDDLAVYIDE